MNRSHYEIELELDPARQELGAHVRLTCHAKQPATRLTFLLHRDLAVEWIDGEAVSSYQVSDGETAYRYAPEARELHIDLTSDRAAESPVELFFSYRGHLGITTPWECNRLTPDWVELGMYTPWFPYDPYGLPFSYSIRVSISPDYDVQGLGKVSRHEDTWLIEQDAPVNDMVILAAKALHTSGNPGDVASIYANLADHELAEMIAQQGSWSMVFFREWFADAHERQASIVLAPRAIGGGYARPGLIVITPEDQISESRYFAWLAHEFAHLWWRMAPTDTWEDWLNEAFAEYSSLMAIRARYGQEHLDGILSQRRAKVDGLPAIAGLDRSDDQAYQVLYVKGSLLLCDLAEQIGQAAVTALLRRTIAEEVTSTEQFLLILTDIAGAEVRDALWSSLNR